MMFLQSAASEESVESGPGKEVSPLVAAGAAGTMSRAGSVRVPDDALAPSAPASTFERSGSLSTALLRDVHLFTAGGEDVHEVHEAVSEAVNQAAVAARHGEEPGIDVKRRSYAEEFGHLNDDVEITCFDYNAHRVEEAEVRCAA